MTQTSLHTKTLSPLGHQQANALADRLEEGARALAIFATRLTDAVWQMRVPHDGRSVGVIVHHVASVYPLEIQLAQTVASGAPVRSEEHTSELQSQSNLVCRLLLEKKKK